MVSILAHPLGWRDVTDFGALGDNRQDDTSYFQAAIDSVDQSGGGYVYVPPGRYVITSSLSIASPSTTICGAGHWPRLSGSGSSTELFWRGTSSYLFTISAQGFECRDLAIHDSGNSSGCIYSATAAQGRLDNIRMQGTSRHSTGLTVGDGSDWRISDCKFENFSIGIDLQSNNGATSIIGAIIQTNGTGIKIGTNGGVSGVWVLNSDVERNVNFDIDALRVNNLNIESCYLESQGSGSINIRVGNTSTYQNLRVVGCYFNGQDTTQPAIKLVRIAGARIADNVFSSYTGTSVINNVATAVSNVHLVNNTPPGAESTLIDSYAGVMYRLDSNGLMLPGGVNADTGRASIKEYLSATTSWTPGTIGNGSVASTTVTVTGAALGDVATASFSLGSVGNAIMITAYVEAANTVRVVLLNQAGASVTLGAGTVRASVFKH